MGTDELSRKSNCGGVTCGGLTSRPLGYEAKHTILAGTFLVRFDAAISDLFDLAKGPLPNSLPLFMTKI